MRSRTGRVFSYSLGGGFMAACAIFYATSRNVNGSAPTAPEPAGASRSATGARTGDVILPARSLPGTGDAGRSVPRGIEEVDLPVEARVEGVVRPRPATIPASETGGGIGAGASRSVTLRDPPAVPPAPLAPREKDGVRGSTPFVAPAPLPAHEKGSVLESSSVVRLTDTRVGRQDAPRRERAKEPPSKLAEEDAFLALLASSEKTIEKARSALDPAKGKAAGRRSVEPARARRLARGEATMGEMERECQRASILGSMPPSFCSCEVGEFEQIECRVSQAVAR